MYSTQAKDTTVLQSVLVNLVADAIKERPEDLLDYMIFWGGLHNPDNYTNSHIPTGPYAMAPPQVPPPPLPPHGDEPGGREPSHNAAGTNDLPPKPPGHEQQPRPLHPPHGGALPSPTPPHKSPNAKKEDASLPPPHIRGSVSLPAFSMPSLTDMPPPAGFMPPASPAHDLMDDSEEERPDTAHRLGADELEALIKKKLFRAARLAADVADGAKDRYMMALEDSGYELELLRGMEVEMNEAREKQNELRQLEQDTQEQLQQIAQLSEGDRTERLRAVYNGLPATERSKHSR